MAHGANSKRYDINENLGDMILFCLQLDYRVAVRYCEYEERYVTK